MIPILYRYIGSLFNAGRHPAYPHLIFHKSGAVELDLSHPDVQKTILEKCKAIERIRTANT